MVNNLSKTFLFVFMTLITFAGASATTFEYQWMNDFSPTGTYFTVDDDTFCYSLNTTHDKCVHNDGTTIKTIGTPVQNLGVTGFQNVLEPIGVMQSGVTDWDDDHKFTTVMRKNSTNGQYYAVEYNYDNNTFTAKCALPAHWQRVNMVASLDGYYIVSRSDSSYNPTTHIVNKNTCLYKNTTNYFSTNGPSFTGNCYNSGTVHPIYYSGSAFFTMSIASSGGSGACQGPRYDKPGYYVLVGDALLSRGCKPTQTIPGMPAANCTFAPLVGDNTQLPIYNNVLRDTGASETLLTKPRFTELFTTQGIYGLSVTSNVTLTNTPAYHIPVFDFDATTAEGFVIDLVGGDNQAYKWIFGPYYLVKMNKISSSTVNITYYLNVGGSTVKLSDSEEPIIAPEYTSGTIPKAGTISSVGDGLVIIATSGLLYIVTGGTSSTAAYSEEYDLDLFGRIELTSDVSYGLSGHPCDAYYFFKGVYTIPYSLRSILWPGCSPLNDSSQWQTINSALLVASSSYGSSNKVYKHLYENNTYYSQYNPVELLITKNHTERTLYMAVVCDDGELSSTNPILYYMDASNETETSLNSACNITSLSPMSCVGSISDEYMLFNTTACASDLYKTTGVRDQSFTLTQDFYFNSGETWTLQTLDKQGNIDLDVDIVSSEDVGLSGEDRFAITINGVDVYNVTQGSWPGTVMDEPDRTLITVKLAVSGTSVQYEIIGRESQYCANKPLIATGTLTLAAPTEPYRVRYVIGASGGTVGESGLGDLMIQRGNSLPSYTTMKPTLIYTSPSTGREFYTYSCSLSRGEADNAFQNVAVYQSFDSTDYTNKTVWSITYDEDLASESQLQTINGGVNPGDEDAANAQNTKNFFCASALKVCSDNERLIFAVMVIVIMTVIMAILVYSNFQATFAAHAATVGIFVILFVMFAAGGFLPTWFIVVTVLMTAGGLYGLTKMSSGNSGGNGGM